MEQWAVQKNKLSSPPDATLLDLGFAALFLNRTNRSGILSGGVIGGKKQSGTWRMDARFNKKALIQRIKTIANLKDNIHVTNSDALYFLDSFASTLQCSRTIIFLDPPYFTQGKRLYQNFYQIEDHSQIAIYVQNKITSPWVVTYDNAPEILSLYSNRNLIQYKLSYCASKKYQGAEVMFLADSLILPQKAPYIPGKYSPRKLETASLPI